MVGVIEKRGNNIITKNTHITTKELATILNITKEGVMKRAKREAWSFSYGDGIGRGGKITYFEINKLPENIKKDVIKRQEYIRKHKAYADLPEWQQKQVDTFFYILKKYKEFANKAENRRVSKIKLLTQFTEDFNAGKVDKEVLQSNGTFVVRTLQKYLEKEKKYNETNDLNHIIKQYGKNKGKSRLNEDEKAFINTLYFNQNRLPLSAVHEKYSERSASPLSYWSIRKYIDKISPLTKTKHRKGEKVFSDKCIPYIKRDMETGLDRNSIWSADGHLLNFYVKSDDGKKIFRATVVVWIDIYTRMPVGFEISENENSEMVVDALMCGIKKYGKPLSIYVDNGKAFKNKWLLGATRDNIRVSGLLNRLGIDARYATKYHPQSKGVVEGFWNYVDNHFSKFSNTYCGKNINEKPDDMDKRLKNLEKMISLQELYDAFGNFLENYRTKHKHSGIGGITPSQKWESSSNELVRVDNRELVHASLYREVRQVHQNGILYMGWDYRQTDDITLVRDFLKKNVIIGIDRHDLTHLFVFDDKGRYICEAKRETKNTFLASDAKNIAQYKEHGKIKGKIRRAANNIEKLNSDLQELTLEINTIEYKEDSLQIEDKKDGKDESRKKIKGAYEL